MLDEGNKYEVEVPGAGERLAEVKFTWKNFVDLNNVDKSHNTPLLVIAHVDVNAFFAQLEQLRLGLTSEDPVVCVQWSSLIAVSYAARKFGIGRMDSLESAKRKCPNVIAAHTAVFRKGETFWTYRDAGVLPNAETHKVSLDPYRRESRKMMRIFRSLCDKVEKASVDESFMDFGRLIYKKALEIFPCLRDTPEDLNQPLPEVPKELPSECEFKGVVIANDDEKDESLKRYVYNWDDVFIMMGSKIAHDIRKVVEEELGYTTSCGVSRSKTVSKLASGFIKPNNQTIVRSSAIPNFCDNFDLTDFWSMGGKTGQMMQLKLETPSEGSIRYIRDNFSLRQLEDRLSPDTALASHLYQMVRGELYAPLNLRTDIKSMGSTKNFRGNSVSSLQDIQLWLPVFCADVLQRLQELDEESGVLSGDTTNRIIRRPKTISFHFRTSEFQSFTRQCPLPLILSLAKENEIIFENSCKLARNAIETWNETAHGKFFPLTHFGIGVTNFEEIDTSRSIDEFAVKGGNSKDIINSMFAELGKDSSSSSSSSSGSKLQRTDVKRKISKDSQFDIFEIMSLSTKRKLKITDEQSDDPCYCNECAKLILDEDMTSHKDFHFAVRLSKEYESDSSNRRIDDTTKDKTTKRKKLEKGQSTLPFSR